MNHKRLLLLGIIIIIGVAWIHPITQSQLLANEEKAPLSDTEKVAAARNTLSDISSVNSQNDFKDWRRNRARADHHRGRRSSAGRPRGQ